MKKNTIISSLTMFCLLVVFISTLGCKKRDLTTLQEAEFPKKADVFIDDFSSDLAYAAFGGSDVRAFQIETKETYGNTRQSMRFEVPDANSATGSYAGGVFYSKTGRNLTGFNALTFYIKASQAATIGIMGFGNDLGENKFQVALNNFPVNSNWKKVIIPIPDAAKLTAERGMFFFSAAPENNKGYTFWVDEVKFENLSTISEVTGLIFSGENRVMNTAETGDKITIDGVQVSVNLPTGVNQVAAAANAYFNFTSSKPAVASVDNKGVISVVDAGEATISATLRGKTVNGSLKLTSVGAAILPTTAAPTPAARDAANVVSLFSNAYTNVPVSTWNTGWLYSTAESFFIKIAGDDAIRYRNLNFVGIEFTNPVVNVGGMQFFHMDIWTPDATTLPNNFKILLVDFGANGAFGGGDDSQHEITIARPTLVSNNWVSIDVPMSQFSGLRSRTHLAQMVLSGTIPNVVIDNVYFYRNPSNPTVAAPTPTTPSANVLSIFSDAFTNVAGSDFNPNWGQTTQVNQVAVAGNNTLHYANFNYQGLQLANSINVSNFGFLHLDFYSTNSSNLNVFLISPGPSEKGVPLTVPTAGWSSIDIPLSAFSPVALNNIIQLKFDGGTGGDVYLDNIYFWRLPAVPTTGAPVPTFPAANVISIFSDTYTNLANSDLNPNWGQNTAVTQTLIGGNNTLVYTNLNYQGLQFGSTISVADKSFLHLNYYTANATSLSVSLISPPNSPGGTAPFEKAVSLQVPTSSGWNTVNIPLSSFSPNVALGAVFQLKFEGNGTIYLDNILFR
ncbi:MAG: hypothetical protein ACOVQE_01875 [Chitinophagaceae bacterium]